MKWHEKAFWYCAIFTTIRIISTIVPSDILEIKCPPPFVLLLDNREYSWFLVGLIWCIFSGAEAEIKGWIPNHLVFTQENQLSILCGLSLHNAQCVRVCSDLVTPNDHEWHFTCTACQFCGITLPWRLLDKILWWTITFIQSGSPFWGSADSPSCPKYSVSHLYWSHPAVSCRCIQIAISNSHDQLHPDNGCWDKTVSFNIRRRARSSFYMIIFNQRPHSHRVRQLVSQTLCRTFCVAQCETSIILDISLWESPRLERRTIISEMTGRALVSVHATFVWDGNLHAAKTRSWMRHTVCG